jgi:hypothetical protein
LEVKKIFNQELENKFNKRKTETNAETIQLFHGTKNNCINSICRYGFKNSLNITSAFGHGTYFASIASYSADYMTSKNSYDDEITYMFLCDVLLTTETKNATNIIYVVPNDDDCIPRYIISFHKNAQ